MNRIKTSSSIGSHFVAGKWKQDWVVSCVGRPFLRPEWNKIGNGCQQQQQKMKWEIPKRRRRRRRKANEQKKRTRESSKRRNQKKSAEQKKKERKKTGQTQKQTTKREEQHGKAQRHRREGTGRLAFILIPREMPLCVCMSLSLSLSLIGSEYVCVCERASCQTLCSGRQGGNSWTADPRECTICPRYACMKKRTSPVRTVLHGVWRKTIDPWPFTQIVGRLCSHQHSERPSKNFLV